MPEITIHEALAEVKTIGKRLVTKQSFVKSYVLGNEKTKDPLVKDGGSSAAVKSAMQSIKDLQERLISIRREIALANAEVALEVDGELRSIADWLVWRREIAQQHKEYLSGILNHIHRSRQEARQRGAINVANAVATYDDIVVNYDEGQLARDIEELDAKLSKLDGLLSLKNAQTKINV